MRQDKIDSSKPYICTVYITIYFRVYCLGAQDLCQCLDFNPGLDLGLTSNTKGNIPESYRVYCLGAQDLCQCLDFNPGLDLGLTSNTKSVKTSKNLSYKYLASKNLTNYTTALLSYEYLAFKNFIDYTTTLHRVVSYPKPIKLGHTGSSTKRCGVVKQSKHITKSKFENNFQKTKFFKNYKSITNMTARALVIIFKCNNFFPIKIGQEKIKIFTKLFVPNFKMAMFKTAIRSSIGRPKQKLGQENHFFAKFTREIVKYMQRRENNASMQAPAQDQSRTCS
jgi:hypothetical protein